MFFNTLNFEILTGNNLGAKFRETTFPKNLNPYSQKR